MKELNKKNNDKEKEIASQRSISPSIWLKTIFLRSFNSTDIFPNFSADFEKTFGSSRNPEAIIYYTANLKNCRSDLHGTMKTLEKYVQAVFNKDIKEVRMQDSVHLDTVFSNNPDLKEEWKKGFSRPLRKDELNSENRNLILTDTDDPIDMLLCGTEVASCMDILTLPESCRALLAYCIDGKNRLLALKEEDKIVGRLIYHIFGDKIKKCPVLLMEKVYPQALDEKYKKIISDFAAERAKTLKLPLTFFTYTPTPEEKKLSYPNPLYSLSSSRRRNKS